MTQIDGSSRLAALIRAQVASLGKRAQGAGMGRQGSKAATAGRETDNGGDIAAVVARRIRSIDPDDPERPRKAFRVFLESVLLAELGETLMNDARFYQLVDEVQSRMESDAEIAAAIREAGRLMT